MSPLDQELDRCMAALREQGLGRSFRQPPDEAT
jgi:hypothetical protein